MKKVALLFAVAFVAAPAFANSSNANSMAEEDFRDCHRFACEMAEQGASQGGDIEEFYEMAYDYCTG